MAKNSQLESQNEEVLEKFISNVDTQKVESIKNDLQNYKDSLRNKEYAVSMNSEILERFETYMKEEGQWRSKEALGVKEIVGVTVTLGVHKTHPFKFENPSGPSIKVIVSTPITLILIPTKETHLEIPLTSAL